MSSKKDRSTDRSIHQGFPNPAMDVQGVPLDLNKLVVKNRSSTFYMRVESAFYTQIDIEAGDILAIDRALQMKSGDVYTGSIDGEFVIRKYSGETDEEIDFFGVVTHVIHKVSR